jgi:hypothetical protein
MLKTTSTVSTSASFTSADTTSPTQPKQRV